MGLQTGCTELWSIKPLYTLKLWISVDIGSKTGWRADTHFKTSCTVNTGFTDSWSVKQVLQVKIRISMDIGSFDHEAGFTAVKLI